MHEAAMPVIDVQNIVPGRTRGLFQTSWGLEKRRAAPISQGRRLSDVASAMPASQN
jgi:hypothetical protein